MMKLSHFHRLTAFALTAAPVTPVSYLRKARTQRRTSLTDLARELERDRVELRGGVTRRTRPDYASMSATAIVDRHEARAGELDNDHCLPATVQPCKNLRLTTRRLAGTRIFEPAVARGVTLYGAASVVQGQHPPRLRTSLARRASAFNSGTSNEARVEALGQILMCRTNSLYVTPQTLGGMIGVAITHAMYARPTVITDVLANGRIPPCRALLIH